MLEQLNWFGVSLEEGDALTVYAVQTFVCNGFVAIDAKESAFRRQSSPSPGFIRSSSVHYELPPVPLLSNRNGTASQQP